MVEAAAVCPTDVIVPVVFLPGIMGSRLKSASGTVWDPDSKAFMLWNYGRNAGSVAGRDVFGIRERRNVRAAAARRKQMLIGGAAFRKNYLTPIEFAKIKGLTQTQIARNWSSVSLATYGPLLRSMESTFPLHLQSAIKKVNPRFNLVSMPVYACGYNWSQSNYDSGRAVAAHIKKWVAEARKLAAARGAQCPGAIVVTHSMGGFVARSAALMHGAAGDIMAVISTVMPTDGAPAAYKRFHFGFENPGWSIALGSYIVLGRQGALVTALLGHMPGAQELLPNKRYRDNNGSRQWLHILNPNRNMLGRAVASQEAYAHLPQSNPYTEIYRRSDRMYRAANPEWLFPEGTKSSNPFNEFMRHNEVAEAWHDKIIQAGDFHELTYTCHSADASMRTYDFVSWSPDMTLGGSGLRSVREDNLKVDPGNTPSYRRENVVWGDEEDKHINGGYMGFGTDWTILPASGAGDMTVPISASISSISGKRRATHSPGYEHEGAVKAGVVSNWVRDTMAEILGRCELY